MNNSRNREPGFGRFRHHLIATSLAAMLVLAGGIGHALAQEDDDDELPDTKFLKGMLHQFGLKKDGELKSGINYQERPPLVVPPTRDLPPPQTTDAVRGNAAWPKDQDEQRRREASTKRRKDVRVGDFWEDLGRQSTPNELRKGASTRKDDALSKRSPQEVEDAMRQYKPSELGYVGGMFGNVKDFFVGAGDQIGTFEAEPPRASLTDPPTGYRSPSPTQVYGLSKDSTKAKPMTEADRVSADDLPTKR